MIQRTVVDQDVPHAQFNAANGAAAANGVVLVPWMVAGVQTQYEQMRRTAGLQAASAVEVRPYREGGIVERLPLPGSLRGTIRSTLAASPLLRMAGVRAVWTQVALPMLPFAIMHGRRVPVFYAIDCTPRLLHAFGAHYGGVDDPATPQGRLTAASLRLFFRRCAGLLPWSRWAARSMIEDYGADRDRVDVVAPGIDLQRWAPAARKPGKRPRLLFVGGDFERKGGPLLLEIFRGGLRDLCDVHLVTRANLDPEPGVFVHSGLTPAGDQIRALYQASDILVVPTLADCFSMAALEAMACGIPVVISSVGGIPEIVVDGQTGILVEPGQARPLVHALRTLLESPGLRRRLGEAGRRRAETLFDARVQSARTMEIIHASVRSRA